MGKTVLWDRRDSVTGIMTIAAVKTGATDADVLTAIRWREIRLMGASDYYVHGSYNVICDRCGFKYKHRQLFKEWNGLRTCRGGRTNNCWEERHPQDFVKSKADRQNPPWVRPENEDDFV